MHGQTLRLRRIAGSTACSRHGTAGQRRAAPRQPPRAVMACHFDQQTQAPAEWDIADNSRRSRRFHRPALAPLLRACSGPGTSRASSSLRLTEQWSRTTDHARMADWRARSPGRCRCRRRAGNSRANGRQAQGNGAGWGGPTRSALGKSPRSPASGVRGNLPYTLTRKRACLSASGPSLMLTAFARLRSMAGQRGSRRNGDRRLSGLRPFATARGARD